jgi:ribosome biogenesis protein SSF1/2
MPRRGRHRKKTRTHVVATDERITSALHSNDDLKVPRSLVIRRGKVESEITELVMDIRNLLRPYTALNFKEDATNRKMTLAKYASELTGPLGITHIVGLSQNASKISLRIGRTPAGPTLTFRVKRFTLGRQVRVTQRRPYDATSKSYDSPPIVVTNNFGDVSAAPHVKLMRITFQNMFPAINVSTVKLGDCRRVVLFNLIRRNNGDDADDDDDNNNDTTANKKKRKKDDNDDDNNDDDNDLEDEEVEIRHYAIRTKPIGIDKRVRRIVESKIPNLGKLYDIADYIAKSSSSPHNDNSNGIGGGDGYQSMSDSEAEDETNQVELPISTSNMKRKKGSTSSNAASSSNSNKSAIKLVELGPRLRLKLYKVERLLCAGDVMYHAYVTKTPSEILALRTRKDEESKLKKRRREEQESNVKRKQMALEEKKVAREARRKERENKAMSALRGEIEEEEGGRGGGDNVNDTEEMDEEEDYDNDDSDEDDEQSGDENDGNTEDDEEDDNSRD